MMSERRITQLKNALQTARDALVNNLVVLDAYGGPSRNALARDAIDIIDEAL